MTYGVPFLPNYSLLVLVSSVSQLQLPLLTVLRMSLSQVFEFEMQFLCPDHAVIFYRCGHCKSLAPVSVDFSSYCFVMCIYTALDSSFLLLSVLQTYEKVASAFKLEEDVIVANLDADQHKDLAEK